MKLHKQLPDITTSQLEIINGSLLGDGSLCTNHKKIGHNWSFCKNQSKFDNDGHDKCSYMKWHYDMLAPYSSQVTPRTYKHIVDNSSGKLVNVATDHVTGHYYAFSTYRHPFWTQLASKWYLNENGEYVLRNKRIIKIVPKDLRLTPLTLCVWFMDDGFLYPRDGNATLNTQGFTIEECAFLVDRLLQDTSIHAKVRIENRTGQPFIYIGVKSFHDLVSTISSNVSWDCFRYKIDDSYTKKPHRGEDHSRSLLSEQQVIEMFECSSSGLSNIEIASQFQVSRACVSSILSGKRWSHLKRGTVRRVCRRVTRQEHASIRELSDAGKTQCEIAKVFNTNPSTISRILKKMSSS